ncbi:hypothetical protein [Limimaricola hongkongensis]|nr:hypothetical protein [Limimaricola hongkongensis]
MRHPAFLLPALLTGSLVPIWSQAQGTEPTPEEIVEDWMASGHADAMAEAFRHWDEEGEIPGACAACHSTTGFADYLASPMTTVGAIDHPVPTGELVECTSCHAPEAASLATVPFPSGAAVSLGSGMAVCAVCHQGRASGEAVETAVSDLDDDEVSDRLSFINVHYSAAAATLLGAEVGGGYEYPGQSYSGRFAHVPGFDDCAGCHGAHDTAIEIADCTSCHAGVTDSRAIRTTSADLDGDGDTAEGIASEIATLHEHLHMMIRLYAETIPDAAILYAPDSYPYFFTDLDDDGQASAEETMRDNRYANWTPRLLRAAYNYQFVAKDGGSHAHNPHYAAQLLIDSVNDLAAALPQAQGDAFSRP